MTPCSPASLRAAAIPRALGPPASTTGSPVDRREIENLAGRRPGEGQPMGFAVDAASNCARRRSGSSPRRRGTRARQAHAYRLGRRRSHAARNAAGGSLDRAGTCSSSCVFDSSSACPGLGESLANGVRPVAFTAEESCSLTQPSRIGFGIDQRRADTGRADLKDDVRFGSGADVAEHGTGDHLRTDVQRVQIDVLRTVPEVADGTARGWTARAGASRPTLERPAVRGAPASIDSSTG